MPAALRWPAVTIAASALLITVVVLIRDADAPVSSPAVASAAPQDPVDAAYRAVTVLGGASMYASRSRAQALAELISDEALRDRLDRGFQFASRGLALDDRGRSRAGELMARAMPAGARVLAASDDEAAVAVWTLSLLGIAGAGSPTPVQETWSTEVVQLARHDQSWRVSSLSSAPGPTPIASNQLPSAPAELAAVVQQTEPFRVDP